MPKSKSKKSSAKSDKAEKPQEPVMEISVPDGFTSFMTPIAVVISALLVSGAILYVGSRISGDDLNTTGDDTTQTIDDTTGDVAGETANLPDVVSSFETFTEYESDICKEDGKPAVYLFSTTWCPHCEWIKGTFDKWAKDNSDKVSAYHWEIDTGDNTLTSDEETEVPQEHLDVYEKFNPDGSIPTFVFGCRYARVGNGYETEDDLDAEKKSFDKVVEELI